MKIFTLIICLFWTQTVFAGPFGLEVPLRQGGFYVGKVAPGSIVKMGAKKLRLSEEGYFAFGLNWKEKSPVEFTVTSRGGKVRHHKMQVSAQTYDVQRIDGLPAKMVTPPKEVLARISKDGRNVSLARKTDSNFQYFREKFIWPVRGRISGQFGNHRILNGKAKSPHGGMDIAAKKGTPIVAPLGGRITMVDNLYYTGNTVLIDHGFGVNTVYAHMNSVDVRVGDYVALGDRIGTVGMTGRATGPHLHWGLNWYGERLNPALVVGQ